MLTKDDKKEIGNIVGEMLADFFHKTLMPYLEDKFNQNDRDHKEMRDRFDQNEREHQKMFEEMTDIKHSVNNHERRISKIESSVLAS